jgi:hypothetical protein
MQLTFAAGSRMRHLALMAATAGAMACASSGLGSPANRESGPSGGFGPAGAGSSDWMASIPAPNPDPRVGLKAGQYDAAEAAWNMRVVSKTKPSEKFLTSTNSDLAFKGNYVIQGSYNGYQIWDISNPAAPKLRVANYCPASQSDVSVYGNLLFVSAEGNTGRIDCGAQGVTGAVSNERIRGLRIFDISDIDHFRNVANIQTCRGSHTHTVLVDPNDKDNVYVYISGSAPTRDEKELAGCVKSKDDPNTPEFRIEAIKVPLAHPEQAAVVSSPRIFNGLRPVSSHGASPADIEQERQALARGEYVGHIFGGIYVLPPTFTKPYLDSIAKVSGRTTANAADSATLRTALPSLLAARFPERKPDMEHPGVTSCHDITVFPAVGYAGGACEGYGLLIDIKNPAMPVRVAAVADSNFSYWHSATFNNDGTKLLFSDEWGGGGAPKCRVGDPMNWGADAIFTIEGDKLNFQSYYKMPAPQTNNENCVAHNGSLIPIPGRDVMVQSWYQGGISVFDWTDAKHPREIAFWDRGPVDSTRQGNGGTWSVYWYNGVMVSSEISRGLDILELTPSPFISQNEIDAAKTVKLNYLNTQGQPKFIWPATFSLAKAYVDQIERQHAMGRDRVAALRQSISNAEGKTGRDRKKALEELARELNGDAGASGISPTVGKLAAAVRDLADVTQ